MATARSLATCAFCRIVKGETPSLKLDETELSYAFIPLPPLTESHALIIPKDHAVKMHELPDEYLADAITVAKKIAINQGLENYNILQNNGRVAYQTVDHVHFHVISKPDENSGLVVHWPPQGSPEKLDAARAEAFARLGAVGKTVCEPHLLDTVLRGVFSR
ncbi:HIT-like protein [Boletus coccyginus]|nr:HIT-like protein [Boletus coccyginus]